MKETNVRVLHKSMKTCDEVRIVSEKMKTSNKSLNPTEYGYIWYENASGNLEKRYIYPSIYTYKNGKQVIQMIFQDEFHSPHIVTPTQQKLYVYYDSE